MSAKAVSKSSKPGASKEPSAVTKLYLFAYNAGQVVGWSYILWQLVNYYILQGPEFRAQVTLWEYTRLAVIIFQNAAFVEILNASFGLVKSNPVVTGFQVFSRTDAKMRTGAQHSETGVRQGRNYDAALQPPSLELSRSGGRKESELVHAFCAPGWFGAVISQ